MKIDPDKCINCGECQPYCSVSAIRENIELDKREIMEDDCVECGICMRVNICSQDAIYQQELSFPRVVRQQFSNPGARHPSKSGGRGTEEMKTNDVTNRFKEGFAGVCLEFGRPSVGARFRDIQVMTQRLASSSLDLTFEQKNPTTALMIDRQKGLFDPAVLNEKVLSAIIEFVIPLEKLETALKVIKKTAPGLKTVFSLNVISCVYSDGSIPTANLAEQLGFTVRPNTKTNIGLGRATMGGVN